MPRIEALIATHRRQYTAALDASHDGEADYHETQVDDLLAAWQQITHGQTPPLTLAESET